MKFTIILLLVSMCAMAMAGYERPPYRPRPTFRPVHRIARAAGYERPPYLPRPTFRPVRIARAADYERPPYLPRPTFRPINRYVREAPPAELLQEDALQF
ncbi:PREDICTED: uncharacterized protein LOC108616858 [Drosophila arizonae]|uniref:Uncharacterized protein LOC108616858 n=1 Tax=Drosophila arizonae TaxID=7263 RepID=A0ABM1PKW1_DROAR|nr:PREDICTED: uncharacterized protein LOC108616858 [Drosophila arizonae]